MLDVNKRADATNEDGMNAFPKRAARYRMTNYNRSEGINEEPGKHL
jgi:hypothetical protein